MTRNKLLAATLMVATCVLSFASASEFHDSRWGLGVRLGSVSGPTVQYRMERMDLIGAASFGVLCGGWFAIEGGVNFQVMHWDDWTPGRWAWTSAAVADVGYGFEKDACYFGVFVPQRLNYTFPNAPWAFFVELGPGMEMLPDLQFDLSSGIGATYLFD